MGLKVRAFFVVVLIALASVAAPKADAAVTDLERQARDAIHSKINKKRVNDHALAKLKLWTKIQDQAQKHSGYLYNNHYESNPGIAHNGFCDGWNGSACGSSNGIIDSRVDKISAAGSGIGSICENVAFVGGSIYNDPSVAAKKLVSLWVNSPGHYACLFDQISSKVWGGVGVKHVGTYWYATFLAAGDSTPSAP